MEGGMQEEIWDQLWYKFVKINNLYFILEAIEIFGVD
jgi:hypothetical protein